jgi:CRP-like cAMP-binding protein
LIDQLINNNTPSKFFSKGEILQKAGQVSSKAYYVKKGLLRSYTIDHKGKEHIYMFASEGWIVSDVESQIFNNKTALFIDAIENSEVYLLDVSELKSTIKNSDDSSIMINSLLKRVGVMQRRIIALMSSSATERYQSFLQIYPELPNRVPQKMIASYLGITPEGLSRVRKEVVREK